MVRRRFSPALRRRDSLWLATLAVLAACASRRPGPDLPVPQPESGRLAIVAVAADSLGEVQPVAVAITNGTSAPIRVEPQQLFVLRDDARVAPLAPGEAARRVGGERAPGALKGGAIGAASGGVLGAIGGAISGAIQGGIGTAVAAGSAVGAAIGAITGVFGGSRQSAPDVGAFQDRALQASTLAPGFSASGYVYYPAGDYQVLEILLSEPGSATVRTERATIERR